MDAEKFDRLIEAMKSKGKLLVMYSGGLDSLVLALIARRALGESARAISISSPIIPARDMAEAEAGAAEIGIPRTVLEINELLVDEFSKNGPDRCYLCRKIRNRIVKDWAASAGFEHVAEGMNASDIDDYRPGRRASIEDWIWQPFIEFGITKDEIREYARGSGIRRWDRPATVCLCSRFPYGTALSEEAIRRVENAETVLHDLGFYPCRVRSFPGGVAMIEVAEPERLMPARQAVAARLVELGFTFAGLDLEGFKSGKLNRMLKKNG